MVDAAIVMIENAHKRLERAAPDKTRTEVIIEAMIQVGPALFFSLLIITVSFLPIFALEAQEGRLFKPLAYTKTFAMAAAAFLSVTLVPALMTVFVRGRIIPEQKNPLNRFLVWAYRPVILLALRFKWTTIAVALTVLAASLWPAAKLGTEFMPNLNEGTLFYAHHAAGTIGDQGRGIGADARQDHQVVPRGRLGLGQSGPRLNRHRPGADRNV
jgi:Cu(I)/Ag(I) efflux system membrane protein CusA/SilA